MNGLAWMNSGLCAQADPDLWFPNIGESARDAKQVCCRCPVIDPCLAYALQHKPTGIWGGTSPDERKQLLADQVEEVAA